MSEDRSRKQSGTAATKRELRASLWCCYLASGADTDGMTEQEFFAATDEPIVRIVEAVEQLRKDYDALHKAGQS